MSTDTQWIIRQLKEKKIGQAEADFLLQKLKMKVDNNVSNLTETTRGAGLNGELQGGDDLGRKLKKILAESLGYEESRIDKNAMFDTYALDSVAALDIVRKLELEFGSLPKTVLFEYPTLAALETFIQSKYHRKDEKVVSIRAADVRATDVKAAEIQAIDNGGSVSSLTGLQERLKRVFCSVFDFPPSNVHVNTTFDKLGVDSVGGLQFVNELDKNWGPLPKTILFEYPSISELAGYLVDAKTVMQAPTVVETREEGLDIHHSVENTNVDNQPIREVATSTKEDIAIVGVSGRYPGAKNIEAFESLLVEGRSSITEVPPSRWDWKEQRVSGADGVGSISSHWGGFIEDCDKFDAEFFNITPVEAIAMDPQERLFLETSWSVLEDAGYAKTTATESGAKVGVFVGVMNSDYDWLAAESYCNGKPSMAQSAHWSIANRVSHYFGFNGPSLSVDTACSSSLASIHLACESIKNGECESAIAGGVNLILHPMHYGKLSWMGMLSPDGKCKSFGAGANGFVDGEGVGAVLLKPLSKSMEDGDHIYGVIKGSAINSGGKTPGYTVPNPNAQAELILSSLSKSGVDASTVSYVEAHGTGTELGDPIEVRGLSKAFEHFTEKKQYCALGSVKSNIGHLESAAGIASFTKVLLQLKRRQLFPSLHAEVLNPHITFEDSPFYVQTGLSTWVPQGSGTKALPLRAAISSFGAGGTNVSVVVEEYRDLAAPKQVSRLASERAEEVEHLFLFSANSYKSLAVYLKDFRSYLSKINDVCVDSGFTKLEGLQSDIKTLIADLMGLNKIDVELDESFSELGFSVSDVVLLVSKINDLFSTSVGQNSITCQDTPNQLCDYLINTCKAEIRHFYQGKGNVSELPLVETDNFSEKLSDIAYTLSVHRQHMSSRLAIVARTRGELIDRISNTLDNLQHGEPLVDDVWKGNSPESGAANVVTKLLSSSEGGQLVKSMYQYQKADLANTYAIGADVPWDDVYDAALHRRVSIPTYRFVGESYWIDNDGPKQLERADRYILPDINYEKLLTKPEWVKVERLAVSEPQKQPAILILKEGDEKALQLARKIEEGLDACLFVYLTENSENLINESEISNFLQTTNGKVKCHILLECRGVGVEQYNKSSYYENIRAYDQSLLNLFRLLYEQKNLARVDQLTLLLLNQQMNYKLFDQVSSLSALIMSIGNDYGGLDARVLHVVDEGIVGPANFVLGHMPTCFSAGSEMLLDNGMLYRQTLVPINPMDIPTDVNPYKHNGVYIIFGGLGGIGYTLAKHLILRANARLVIAGSKKDPSHQKDRWQALRQLTSNASYVSADVLDEEAVARVLKEAKKQYGPVNGVFYSAGKIMDAAAHEMSETAYHSVMDCKALGFMNVAKATAGLPLDFLMTFSSAASLKGPAGQSNYSTACLFQDLYAQALNYVRDYPVQTINWGYWGEIGMAADGGYHSDLEQQGILPLTNIEGMALVDAITGLKAPKAVGLKLEQSIEKVGVEQPKVASEVSCDVTQNVSNEGNISEKVKLAIKEATEISVSERELNETWDDLGVSSILAVKILEKIEHHLHVRIYQNELLETGSPAGLIKKLTSEISVSSNVTVQIEDHEKSEPSQITDRLSCQKRPSQKKPVTFLLSTPRSGSTLLRVMLEGHPEIFSPPELHLLPFKSLKQRKNILTKENKLFIREGMIECIRELRGVDAEHAARIMSELEDKDMSIAEAYQELANLASGKIVIDKSPSYGESLEILQHAEEYCEEPKYIFLIRHPLSVMESFVRNRFDKLLNVGSDDPWKYAEKLWVNYNSNIQQWLKAVPSGRACFVRYEDLVAEPEVEIKKICQLLDIDFDLSMLNPYEGNRMTSGLKEESISIGDPNFLKHSEIDKSLAETWKGCEERIDTLDAETIVLAEKMGYSLKKKTYDLHPAQENYLSYYGKSPRWCLTYRFDIEDGQFCVTKFQRACAELVKRHEALRLSFIKKGTSWKQFLRSSAESEVVYKDIYANPADLEKAIQGIELAFFENMTVEGELTKFAAIRYAEDKIKVIIFSHHLVVDGISLAKLATELKEYKTPCSEPVDQGFLTLVNSIKKQEFVCQPGSLDAIARLNSFDMEYNYKDPNNNFASESCVKRLVSYEGIAGVTPSRLFSVFSVALYRVLASMNSSVDPVISHRLHRRWFGGGYEECVGWLAGDVPMAIGRNQSVEKQNKQFIEKFKRLQGIAVGYEQAVVAGELQPAHEYSPVRLNYQPIHAMENAAVVEVDQYDSPDNGRLYVLDIILRSYTDTFEVSVKYSKDQYDRERINSLLKAVEEQMLCVALNDVEIGG